MRSSIKKWGNSAAIRLPSAILEALCLKINQPIYIREEDGRVILEPCPVDELSLDDLIKAITDDNRHTEHTFGSPIGKEQW